MRPFFLPAFLLLASVVFGLDTDNYGTDLPYKTGRTNLYTGQCGRRIIGTRGKRHLYPLSLGREMLPDDDVVPAIERRIIGGSFARPGEFPWLASISRWTKSSIGDSRISLYCSATIINEFWLVTAAHCVYKITPSMIVIDVGDWNLHDDNDPGQERFHVDKFILHEQYNHDRSLSDYDIALIKIKPSAAGKGIQFNNYVQPVCLPDVGDTFNDDTMCVLAGWGRTTRMTEAVNLTSTYLKKLDVPIVNQLECRQRLPFPVSDLILCAGDMRGGSGACSGDSGGGLFCKTAMGYTLAGVAFAVMKNCAEANVPDMYVRVTSFVSWIDSAIDQNSGN